jgi:Zn-finger nucleic acid-binding protein
MKCPLGDAELTSHTAQGKNNLTVSYSTCPSCRGYWMDSFAANFIKITDIDSTAATTTPSVYYCPVCTKQLTRSTGDNIPDDVYIYVCPDNHGYFFPTGQLAAFKKAQQTKIEYHKLWHIAMPNVGSILLGSFILLLLSGGLAVTFQALQERQTIESQAKQILVNHAAYPSADHATVLITATTGTDASVTVHIPSFHNFSRLMQTSDNRTHELTIDNIPAGTYHYFFTVGVSGRETQSDIFTFTIRVQ